MPNTSSLCDDVRLLSRPVPPDHRLQLWPVQILCGPSQTAVKVMPNILSSSPFRHEYARQQPASNNMTMYLPDDTAGAVTRLLVYTNGDNSYLKYPRERNLSNAEEKVQDYLLSTKYKVQQVKNDIIRFLGSMDVACTEEYDLWLDFVTKVYQGLAERDSCFQN
ncbi:MAG: hypothetical protein Q9199_001773 [Rusavskia elegans]